MRPLPANRYLIGFVLLGLTLFALIGFNLLAKVENVQQAIQQEKNETALEEMRNAIGVVYREANRIAGELARWDEIHQQLTDPTYYVYWRDLRLKESDRFPGYILASELYDHSGKALLQLPYAKLPASVPAEPLYTKITDGKIHLYTFAPIAARGENGTLAGYIGMKIDFIEALRRLNRFVHINPDSLSATVDSAFRLTQEATLEGIRYALIEGQQSSRLGDAVIDSLRDLFVLFVGMLLLSYFMVTRLFSQPLRRLADYIGELRRGVHNFTPSQPVETFFPVSEMVTVRHSLDEYQEELDITQARLDRQNVELWQLAHHDTLTGVHNRLAFDEDWRRLVEMTRDKRIDIALMLFDCDFFKAINDTYGHATGDRVIQNIADTLQQSLRHGDKLYRLGGDEFITILVNTGSDEANVIAGRCVQSVQQTAFSRLGIKESVKLSVGIAHTYGTDIANLSELPRQADMAMYHAKRSTREKIVQYNPGLEQDIGALMSSHIVDAVLRAIDGGENIEMHYQPIVRTDTLALDFHEALVRIRDENGLLPPSDIFPVIMRRGLEVELDKAVLRAVQRDLEAGHLPAGTGISINISGAMLALNDFCENFAGLLPHLERHRIIVEITETSLITHLQHAVHCLRQMRQHGFTIALDDFGSGYSSIRYLANMPVDIVKFDISMVQDLNKDQRTRTIIRHTAALIRDAGYDLVAEGIENDEVHARVSQLNATHLQGYLFGRPQRAPDNDTARHKA